MSQEDSAPDKIEDSPVAPAISEDTDGSDLSACLTRSFEKVALDWSAALDRPAQISVSEITVPDSDTLSALIEKSPIAVQSLAEAASLAVPCVMLASDNDALNVAKAALKDDSVAALDEKAMLAYGELARQIFGSLEQAWIAEGAKGLIFEPGQPETLDALPDVFTGGDALFVIASVRIDDAPDISLEFLFSSSLYDLFASAVPPSEDDISETPIELPNIERILKIKVPLLVEIASKKALVSEVMSFRPGSVVEFEKKSEDLLDLYAAKAHIGRGEAVKIGESFGIRVLDIGALRQRIKDLGAS